MRVGIPVQKSRGIRWAIIIKDNKGQALVETLLCSLSLLLFMFIVINTVFLIQDKVHLIRIARDAARESVIVGGNLSTGHAVARDRAEMYFKDSDNVEIVFEFYDDAAVVCEVRYPRKICGNLLPQAEVTLTGRAVFSIGT